MDNNEQRDEALFTQQSAEIQRLMQTALNAVDQMNMLVNQMGIDHPSLELPRKLKLTPIDR